MDAINLQEPQQYGKQYFQQHPTCYTIMMIIYHLMIRNHTIRHIPNADYNLHPTELALDLGNLDIQRM